MATCSGTKQGIAAGGEPTEAPVAENCGDSLVGKFVVNLHGFKLYDRPEGEVTEELPARHYGGRVKERTGDWIRFEDLRSMDKLSASLSGWMKWRENGAILFEIFEER